LPVFQSKPLIQIPQKEILQDESNEPISDEESEKEVFNNNNSNDCETSVIIDGIEIQEEVVKDDDIYNDNYFLSSLNYENIYELQILFIELCKLIEVKNFECYKIIQNWFDTASNSGYHNLEVYNLYNKIILELIC